MIYIQGPSITVQLSTQYDHMMCEVGDYLVDMGKFCTCVDENPSTAESIDNVPNSKSNYGSIDETATCDQTVTFVYKSRFIKQQDLLPWMELYGTNFSSDNKAFKNIFTVKGNEVTPNALYLATRAERQNAMLKQHISQLASQIVNQQEEQSIELNNLRQEMATLQQYVLKAQDLQIEQLTEKLTKLESKAKSIDNSYGLSDMWDNNSDGDM